MDAKKTCARLSIVCILAFLLASETSADIYKSIVDSRAEAFGNRVCTNKACAQYAAMFIHNGNTKVNPCEDFAEYSCGNYQFHHVLSDSFYEMNSVIYKRLTAILSEPISANDKPVHALTKSFYQKCVDTEGMKSTGKPAILSLLDEIGGWPLLKPTWTEFTVSFEEYLADIHKRYPVTVLFKPDVMKNIFTPDPVEQVLFLFSDNEKLNTIFLKNLAALLGAQDPATVESEIQTFTNEVEVERQNIFPAQSTAQCGSLAEIKIDSFDVKKYVNRLYEGILPVDPNMIVCFEPVTYFNSLHTLFKDKRIFANYAVSIVLKHIFRLTLRKIFNPTVSREKICYYETTDTAYIFPVAQMYVNRHFERDAFAPKITEMVTLMKEELAELINEANWLDEATRKHALIKLEKMKLYVGYIDNVFNDTYVEEAWDIPPTNSSENFYIFDARIVRKRMTTFLSQINQPYIVLNRLKDFNGANAKHFSGANMLLIQFGILQPPFYDSNVPDYINYATIGHITGHEIMHGFDNNGRHHDETGALNNWWTDESANHYVGKTDCYKQQYTDAGVDGLLSLGENIADNIGMKIAYRAYKKMMAKRGGPAEPALPTFEKFSLDQMFFIANANVWCDLRQPSLDHNDPHPPGTTRFTGVMQNMRPFSEAFNCPKASKMNPEKKCFIWQP